MKPRLISVNLGTVRSGAWAGDLGRTGIDKRPVEHRVHASGLGFEGDQIVDTRHHGGADQAGYAYASEDAAWWAREFVREVGAGNFGENLTTGDLDVTGALIGEWWAIGAAVFEVSLPRFPCRTFAGFWDIPDLVKLFTAHGAPGAYLRVITEGDVGAGDPIEVVHRPEHGVSIGLTFRALTTEPELLPRLLSAPQLPENVRNRAGARLAGR